MTVLGSSDISLSVIKDEAAQANANQAIDDAEEAKKSATDFILKEDDQVEFGDISGTIDTKTVIDSNGMKIVKGDNTVASFSSNTIKLGIVGDESELEDTYIDMINESLTIGVDIDVEDFYGETTILNNSYISSKKEYPLNLKAESSYREYDEEIGEWVPVPQYTEVRLGRANHPKAIHDEEGLTVFSSAKDGDVRVFIGNTNLLELHDCGRIDMVDGGVVSIYSPYILYNEHKLGEVIDGTTPITKVPNGAQTTTHVSHVELSEGTYIVVGRIGWAQNATGFRALGISDDPSIVGSLNTMQGHATHVNYTNGTTVIVVPKGETKTVYLNARQNSGSEITISNCWLKATRII